MNYTVPTREEVSPEAQGIFDNLQKNVGMVPNLYAYIGYSANALGNYLTLQQGQAKGAFNAKEREAIFLAVSEVNGCRYCQSAHTALGKMNGFTDEEILQLRQGTHADKKFQTITRLAAAIQETHGRPSQDLLDDFFRLGYDQAALVDLVSLVADKVFANYIHNITQIPIDFPEAPVLEEAVV